MKVKMLTSMAGMNFSWEPGRVVEVADYIGEAWDKAGIAKPVEDEMLTVKNDRPDLKGLDLDSITEKKMFITVVKQELGIDLDGRKSLKTLKTKLALKPLETKKPKNREK